jgi:hypothetical protein
MESLDEPTKRNPILRHPSLKTYTLILGILLASLPLVSLMRADPAIKADVLTQDPSPVEWKSLEQFGKRVSRADFESRLKNVFDPTGSLTPFLRVSDQDVSVFASTNRTDPLATIPFAAPSPSTQPPFPLLFRFSLITPAFPRFFHGSRDRKLFALLIVVKINLSPFPVSRSSSIRQT